MQVQVSEELVRLINSMDHGDALLLTQTVDGCGFAQVLPQTQAIRKVVMDEKVLPEQGMALQTVLISLAITV